jgi:integrative and conjugative element protein (TIGR02256 family)
MTRFVEISGDSIDADELQIKKACELAESISALDYVSLVGCIRELDGWEAIVINVEVEIPQRRIHDIHRYERLAVKFDPKDEVIPEVLALRSDFPLVPHINIRRNECPRSLCIFEEPYYELKLHWTAPFLIRKIREWLTLTSRGELHADDQPLEPLLIGSEGILVLPHNVFDYKNKVSVLVIEHVIDSPNQTTFIAKAVEDLSHINNSTKFLITTLYAQPQTHGLIRSRPRNLAELHVFLESGQLNLLDHLRQQLEQWKQTPGFTAVKNANLIILVLLPKKRSISDTNTETLEIRAFVTKNSIVDIGVDIGIWGVVDGILGQVLQFDKSRTGDSIDVHMLNPVESFNQNSARVLGGVVNSNNPIISSIGVGALGSQTILNLLRMGYGSWKFVDEDVLLPHNLARHALTRNFVGYPKASGMAILAQQMLDDPNIAEPVVENILKPADPESVAKILSESQVILDASTSIAVARFLAHDIDSPARRISLFLNPSASDLVILAEDNERNVKLDMLEMQYYRGIVNEPNLERHLQRNGEHIRYGTSCRDVSNTIPQDLVALNSAIASRALKQIITNTEAIIGVWSTNLHDITTTKYCLPLGEVIEIQLKNWALKTDLLFIEKIHRIRTSKLPNETGGILIGSYDSARRIIYIVETIPAPVDSVEWPTVFIRGSKALQQELREVEQKTEGRLEYIGEWHSHPEGVAGIPSCDDRTAFAWLASIMQNDGFPALMLIASDDNHYNFYLGQMD